jgi:tetratricopeptide (TPR) repeat protein
MRSRAVLWLSGAFAWLALTLGVAPIANAQLDDYDKVVAEAVREFDAGNYLEARALFERAHAQKPTARTWRALGFCAFDLKHYVQATAELQAALADAHYPLSPEQREETQVTLAKAQSYVAELLLETDPVSARVFVDGQPLATRRARLDAGQHVLVARAEGYRNTELTLTLLGGEQQSARLLMLPLELSPADASRSDHALAKAASAPAAVGGAPALTQRWWFWGVLGVVVAGAVVATVVVVHDHSDKADAGTSQVLLQTLTVAGGR